MARARGKPTPYPLLLREPSNRLKRLAIFPFGMTACIFTAREQDVGHRVKCYYSKVNYLSAQNKIELAGLAKDIGNMSLNQINEMLGMEPFPGGDRRLQSLNYVNINDIDAYQKGKAGVAGMPPEGNAVAEGDIENLAQDVAGKSLNGAQTQSLLSVMAQYTDGKLTIGQAVNIVSISIGVTKQQAKDIIEGLE